MVGLVFRTAEQTAAPGFRRIVQWSLSQLEWLVRAVFAS